MSCLLFRNVYILVEIGGFAGRNWLELAGIHQRACRSLAARTGRCALGAWGPGTLMARTGKTREARGRMRRGVGRETDAGTRVA
jgi:hypothetical protein